MKLTKTICNNLRAKEKAYKKFDGGGLYLQIMPSGSKLWRLKYYFLGKEKRFSLGAYPIVTLTQAREKRRQAKSLLEQGIDPAAKKQLDQVKALKNLHLTFQSVAIEWHNVQKERWSVSHGQNILHRIRTNVFPHIGNRPIADITSFELLEMLRIIENRGAFDMAKRIRQICGQVFRYGIITDKCKTDIAEPLKGALKSKKTKHYAAIDIKEIPTFLKSLQENNARLYARTRRAIYLSLLTFVRPGELRKARWADIDMEEKQWTIPAMFMKARNDHIVPLSSQSISILESQYKETGHFDTPWVFPSQIQNNKAMSDGTVNVAIKKLGYHGRMTAHGFRALARTTIREKLKYYPDIIEAQLAHKPSGPLGAAYDRAQFLDDRKIMMQDWADYLDKVSIA